MKRLEEIEARLKAATPGPWEWQDWRDEGEPDFGQWRNSLVAPPETRPGFPGMFPKLPNRIVRCEEPPENQGDAYLIAHAPADLALLARIVRKVVATACERPGPDGEAMCEKPWASRAMDCWPCRIRRELGAAR